MQLIGAIFGKDGDAGSALRSSIRNLFGFSPKNLALYRLAFRHKSVAESLGNGFRLSNERLEYLGDAVLGSVVADYLFKLFPFRDEGFLTEMRSRIVCRKNLNSLSRKLGIDRLVQSDNDPNYTGATSIMGDAFEAFVGALYLDKGYVFTQKVLVERVIQNHLDIDELLAMEVNFKSRIIEWAQKERREVVFRLDREQDRGKRGRSYLVSLWLDGQMAGQGEDQSIKKAEQHAARQALEALNEQGIETGK